MRFRNSVQPCLSLLIAAFFIGVALAGKTYENYEKAEKIFISEIDLEGTVTMGRGISRYSTAMNSRTMSPNGL